MLNIFRKNPDTIAYNYLITFDVINIRRSLVNRVAFGSYALNAVAKKNTPPNIAELMDHITAEVLKKVDKGLIGHYNGLQGEDLQPENFRIIFTSIQQIN